MVVLYGELKFYYELFYLHCHSILGFHNFCSRVSGAEFSVLLHMAISLSLQGYSKISSIDENKSGQPLTQVPNTDISRASYLTS